MQYDEQLPKKVLQLLHTTRKHESSSDELICDGGYVPPNSDLLIDAITTLAMWKNLLLKGLTGSGKKKFAETLSSLFQKQMYSIFCFIDLDIESLLWFINIDFFVVMY